MQFITLSNMHKDKYKSRSDALTHAHRKKCQIVMINRLRGFFRIDYVSLSAQKLVKSFTQYI
jgi:hypothetical protein